MPNDREEKVPDGYPTFASPDDEAVYLEELKRQDALAYAKHGRNAPDIFTTFHRGRLLRLTNAKIDAMQDPNRTGHERTMHPKEPGERSILST